jgi:endogenous inhibitor of DNA gyrase (YacG/DUF329 family)
LTAKRTGRRCPVCGKPTAAEHRPFCSRRCADVDLNRWLSGSYVIAGAEDTPGRNDREKSEASDKRH